MTIRTVARAGLAVGVLAALAGCAPAYYPAYPGDYSRPAYAPTYHRAPSEGTTTLRPLPEDRERGDKWVDPEPAH